MGDHVEQTPDISHLDFDVESEKRHWYHPIDPGLYWCGLERTPKTPNPADEGRPAGPSEITCVDCLHLWIEKGAGWWRRVNRAWYDLGGQP